MNDIQIRYREAEPCPGLGDPIQNHCTMAVDRVPDEGYDHYICPDGCTSLVFAANRNQLILIGPRVTPLIVPIFTGDTYRGTRLRPGAVESVLGMSARSILDVSGPAEIRIAELSGPIASVNGKYNRDFDSLGGATPAFVMEKVRNIDHNDVNP